VISVPVAQELRNIVEWCKVKSSLIPRGDAKVTAMNNLFWVQLSTKTISIAVIST
jgi:hypothetical protein